jgi:hypothetical protein
MAGDCGTVVNVVEERALEGDGDEKIESRVSKRKCVGAAEPAQQPGSARRPAEIKVRATMMRAHLSEGAGQDDESTFLHLLSTPSALSEIRPLGPALRD